MARTWEKNSCRDLVGKHEGMNHFEDLVVDGGILLKCTLKIEWGWWRVLICLKIGTGGWLSGTQ